MNIGTKEIADLTDVELVANFKNCLDAEEKRRQASSHIKFNKNNAKNVGAFPNSNPAFLELKEALSTEINKRKLEVW